MSIKLPVVESTILPPEEGETQGCIQCQAGSKLVLFVTGKCHWMCDYCPLSDNRREIDIMYANERPCLDFSDVIEEAKAMNASGTGITGGDPMMARNRSIEAIKTLKNEFGEEHHIHLYTSIPFNPDFATNLKMAGLDEIRFHLLKFELEKYIPTIEACANAGILTGVELPAEPDKGKILEELLDELNETPIKFVNLNELEITVGNYENMELRGFNISNEITAGAEGSAELATKLKEKINYGNYNYHLKFCTSRYKDAGQLRARFSRRAKANLQPWEEISDDDTIVLGAIYSEEDSYRKIISDLINWYRVDARWINWNKDYQRIELPISIVEEICDEIEVPCAQIEIHPTHERLEVGLVWLNDFRIQLP
tara:strand:- start:4616 stop:5722 length:1107 start_codon:yes stop_codon:yes gene_type:complete